jgi:hypothetical protein
MATRIRSRYASRAVYVFRDGLDSRTDYMRLGTTLDTSTRVRPTVRAAPGDRMADISRRHLGDPRLWWVVAAANPQVFYPLDIVEGGVVVIPDAKDAQVLR